MKTKKVFIGKIPAIIWGEDSAKAFIHVHGKMSKKEYAQQFAEIVDKMGWQTISFDLPEHGERTEEDTKCDIWNGIADLTQVGDYVFENWETVSLFANSIGAYFSLHAYKDRPFAHCLFHSPIVDMEYLIRQMFNWYQIDEAMLEEKKEITTPIETLAWEYYVYVKEHPINKWDTPTEILYGGKDNLQSLDVMKNFINSFNGNLTVSEESEHPFMEEADLLIAQKWMREMIVQKWMPEMSETSPMDADFVNLTAENLNDEHLCCIIRSKKRHPGVEAKRQWLSDRLKEGHVFRKLNEKATVFVEYAPLETAWVPIIGDNYYYLYCLWALGRHKGKGYGKSLMDYCLADAIEKGKSGICMLGAKKQKAWLSDQSFAKKFGFEVVDTTDNGYELLALSFDGTTPRFAENAKDQEIESKELTIYYDMQCPYVYGNIEKIKQYCETEGIPVSLIQVDTLQKAKELPCVFNNWGVFYKGKFETVNLSDVNSIKRILKN